MESVVFLLFSSSIISMLGGTIQEPWIQKVYLGSRAGLVKVSAKSRSLEQVVTDVFSY
jgi:hypothetical protein